jgi:hypothetical protein
MLPGFTIHDILGILTGFSFAVLLVLPIVAFRFELIISCSVFFMRKGTNKREQYKAKNTFFAFIVERKKV